MDHRESKKICALQDFPKNRMDQVAQEVLQKIENKGFEAYFVGGYPRDLYMQRNCLDIDICTNATPKQLKEIFKTTMDSNIQYGSFSIFYKKIRFEITTYRRETNYQNHRRPSEVTYISSLEEDLQRRDFTINTLCMDKMGNIYDYFSAAPSIQKKEIRMIGDPKIRLQEDALRILRAIRFATTLDFNLEPNLKKYIKKYGYLLESLSFYRKKEELNKIFTSIHALKGIQLLKELHLEKHLGIKPKRKIIITTSALGIWAQLEVDAYPFPKNEKILMEKIKSCCHKNIENPYVLYSYGLYICSIVGEIKGMSKKDITQSYSKLPIHSRKDIEISVEEITNCLNQKPGPYLKDIYSDLEHKILSGTLKNEKEVLKNYILHHFNK